jgi:hypothetical protein
MFIIEKFESSAQYLLSHPFQNAYKQKTKHLFISFSTKCETFYFYRKQLFASNESSVKVLELNECSITHLRIDNTFVHKCKAHTQ